MVIRRVTLIMSYIQSSAEVALVKINLVFVYFHNVSIANCEKGLVAFWWYYVPTLNLKLCPIIINGKKELHIFCQRQQSKINRLPLKTANVSSFWSDSFVATRFLRLRGCLLILVAFILLCIQFKLLHNIEPLRANRATSIRDGLSVMIIVLASSLYSFHFGTSVN